MDRGGVVLVVDRGGVVLVVDRGGVVLVVAGTAEAFLEGLLGDQLGAGLAPRLLPVGEHVDPDGVSPDQDWLST